MAENIDHLVLRALLRGMFLGIDIDQRGEAVGLVQRYRIDPPAPPGMAQVARGGVGQRARRRGDAIVGDEQRAGRPVERMDPLPSILSSGTGTWSSSAAIGQSLARAGTGAGTTPAAPRPSSRVPASMRPRRACRPMLPTCPPAPPRPPRRPRR
ncbi:hypothetical protein ACVOMT_24040 (plasmid) [Sphingomonas panni]